MILSNKYSRRYKKYFDVKYLSFKQTKIIKFNGIQILDEIKQYCSGITNLFNRVVGRASCGVGCGEVVDRERVLAVG